MNSDYMTPAEKRKAWKILAFNTIGFTVCFAVWMMNGVLVTFLVDNGVLKLDPAQIGWLLGIPVLTGSIFRLPLGILTDRYGGRIVYGSLLLLAAVPTFLVSRCGNFNQFALAGLGFGFTGTAFAVGIAYTSVWFPKRLQGTALGIFGAGNAGAAITSLGAPHLLNYLTNHGENIEGWRTMPQIYAAALVVMGTLFLLFTHTRIPPGSEHKTLAQRLAPLRHVRVWRFGLYYFFVFGGFVALAQWLIPYYVNAYSMSVAMAGTLAAVNSLPSGVIRAIGGWLSDVKGARAVMYGVFEVCLVCTALLVVPQMDIRSPGSGIMARAKGEVVSVAGDSITVRGKAGDMTYKLRKDPGELVSAEEKRSGNLILPRSSWWQEPIVKPGDAVAKKQLLARGTTEVFFQANVWVFTILSLILGAAMGIGKAAVYKYIPDYFPNDVGVVGGIVGVIGGLGGFVCPVIFGYMLRATGLWTTCWVFFFVLTAVCLAWLHVAVRGIMREKAGEAVHFIEAKA